MLEKILSEKLDFHSISFTASSMNELNEACLKINQALTEELNLN